MGCPMGRKPETELKDKVLKDLRRLGAYAVKIQQVSINGTADILACLNGRFIALELKSAEGKVSPIQTYNIKNVKKSGGLAYIVTPEDWPTVYKFLKLLY